MSLIIRTKNNIDPLGLGIKKQLPENYIFSTEDNNKFFTRSLLSEEDKKKLDEEGILTIEQVRSLIIENSIKEISDSTISTTLLDVELLILIDSRINYNIYIVDDNIYLYNELYMSYPFQEFNVDPESIFCQQTIGFFTNGETTVVDFGESIIAVDDLVGLATKKDYIIKNKPSKIIDTKIYIGKEKWKDFAQLHKFFRGIARVSMMQIENSETPNFLKPFTMAMSSMVSKNLLCSGIESNIESKIESKIESNLESKNVESNIESKNVESKNVESKNVEFKNVESKNIESKNLESKNIESKNLESKNVESKNIESNLSNIELNKKVFDLEDRILKLELILSINNLL